MSSPHDEPTLDDVIDPTEHLAPDHRQHGGMDPRPNTDQIDELVEHERRLVHGDDGGTEVPPAAG
ncbi:hypothetical protein NUM3379_02730 [Kineococcus sp. NUM-3379]